MSAAALVFFLGGAGCTREPATEEGNAFKGGSITVALAQEPSSLDPAVATDPSALSALWLVHTPPLTYARAEGLAGTRLVPGLAARRPEVSADSRTFSFVLRPGLRYSEGRPLRAQDFERAVKRALRLHPAGTQLFGNIVGARAYAGALLPGGDLSGVSVDERTREVRVQLTEPDPAFLFALASPLAAPVPRGTPVRDRSASPPPGIGPYRLARPRPDTSFVLSRTPGFELAGVPSGNANEVIGVVQDPAGATRSAIDGFTDAVEGRPPLDLLPQVRSEFKERYTEYPTLAVHEVFMNPDRAPFDQPDVRRAVAFSLDEAVLARLSDNFLTPSCNVLPPAVAGHETLDPCPFGEREENSDLVRARSLVQEAERPRPRVVVAPASGAADPRLEGYLIATLRKIGLRARPALDLREEARAPLTYGRRRPSAPHPARYLEAVREPVLDTRISLTELEGEPETSAAAWAEIDRDVVEGATVAPYGVETSGVLLSERMDVANCPRFHPVFGLDWSSLCLR